MYKIYWIKYPTHTNPNIEGYIGLTSQTIEKRFSEVNLANANNGRIVPIETITKYYIFVEEIKTIAENRDEKLKEIL